MPQEPIKPVRLETFERTRGVVTPVGCLDVETDHGVIHFHDGPGLMTMALDRVGLPSVVAIMTYRAAEPGDRHGVGLLAQMEPDFARSVAASLLRLADRIDGGKAPN